MYYADPIYSQSDVEIISFIGKYLKNSRLEINLSQEKLAIGAGLDRTSISGIEHGRPSSLITFIQILRTLGKLELLKPFLEEEPFISPIKMVELQGKKKKYASSKKKSTNNKLNESEW